MSIKLGCNLPSLTPSQPCSTYLNWLRLLKAQYGFFLGKMAILGAVRAQVTILWVLRIQTSRPRGDITCSTLFNHCSTHLGRQELLMFKKGQSRQSFNWIGTETQQIWPHFDPNHVFFAPIYSKHCLALLCSAAVVREGYEKYWCWQIWNHCERNPYLLI